MLAPWLSTPEAAAAVDRWSERTGLDLRQLGTEASADEVTDTAVAQPLIVALALLSHRAAPALPTDTPVAGHSVGELAAAALAGVIGEDDAVALAAVRGAEMAKACALEDTSMAAVMLGEPDAVVAWLADNGLDAANRNGAGQIVASGPAQAIDTIVEQPLDGTKVRKIPVAGAFHTRFMAPARDAMAKHTAALQPKDPTRPLLSNADGQVVTSGAEYLQRLVDQVTSPVRWDLCMDTLAAQGVDAVVELAPGGTLAGLVRRQLKGTKTVALKKPDDLAKLDGLTA